MTGSALLSKDGRTLMVRVPLALRKRGGRKLVITPEGATWAPPRPRITEYGIECLKQIIADKRAAGGAPPPATSFDFFRVEQLH